MKTLQAVLLFVLFSTIPGCKESNVKNQFDLYDLSGNPQLLSEFDDSYLLVNFWATWCRPCIEEMPTLHNLDSIMNDNLVVILISEESPEKITAFRDKYAISLPMYRMPDAINKFKLQFLPTTMLISPSGRVLFVEEGERVWDAPDMQQIIADAMK